MGHLDDMLPEKDYRSQKNAIKAALEQQIVQLDAIGERIAAAHVDMAVQHLATDLSDDPAQASAIDRQQIGNYPSGR